MLINSQSRDLKDSPKSEPPNACFQEYYLQETGQYL